MKRKWNSYLKELLNRVEIKNYLPATFFTNLNKMLNKNVVKHLQCAQSYLLFNCELTRPLSYIRLLFKVCCKMFMYFYGVIPCAIYLQIDVQGLSEATKYMQSKHVHSLYTFLTKLVRSKVHVCKCLQSKHVHVLYIFVTKFVRSKICLTHDELVFTCHSEVFIALVLSIF